MNRYRSYRKRALKGDLLMQAQRARAVFGTLGEAVRDGEAYVKNTQSRRA